MIDCGGFNIKLYLSDIKDIVERRKKEKALCEHELKICKEAIKESLEPQVVWIQEKERYERRIKEIDEVLGIFEKFARLGQKP